MSEDSARRAVERAEKNLEKATEAFDKAEAKVLKLEGEIADLERKADKASSESMRKNHLRRAQSKKDALKRARRDVDTKRNGRGRAEKNLSETKRKLRGEEGRARQREERKEREEKRRREREARAETRRQRSMEARRAHEVEVLKQKASELEERLAERERQAAPPEISVLFLASSPEDQPPLRLDRETREIRKRLRSTEYRDSIRFELCLARQLPDLLDDLNEVEPAILHFSGHSDEQALVFEDEAGDTRELDNEQLGRLLEAAGDQTRLMVFNSCDSAAQAEIAAQHVDLAIGMTSPIGDESAKVFAGQFYNSLGFGHSLAKALRQARFQMEVEGVGDPEVPKLFAAEGVDPETVVLVNPDADKEV